MKTVVGVFCLTVCILGIIFFRNYQGTIIPFPFAWVILLTALGLLGFWLIYLSQKEKLRTMSVSATQQLDQFKKEDATPVELDFDKCEFKKLSYTITSDNHVPPGILAFDNSDNKEQVIVGSCLIYTDMINGKAERFFSQAFPFDEVVLKQYVLNKQLILYINRTNDNKYHFELKD